MTAFNTATLFLFAGVGLVALAIGFLSRRYSSPAFLVGLAGLLALATATTWITVAVPMTNAVQLKQDTEDDADLPKAQAAKQVASAGGGAGLRGGRG
jgi:Na+/H+ antiporter NhaC